MKIPAIFHLVKGNHFYVTYSLNYEWLHKQKFPEIHIKMCLNYSHLQKQEEQLIILLLYFDGHSH